MDYYKKYIKYKTKYSDLKNKIYGGNDKDNDKGILTTILGKPCKHDHECIPENKYCSNKFGLTRRCASKKSKYSVCKANVECITELCVPLSINGRIKNKNICVNSQKEATKFV